MSALIRIINRYSLIFVIVNFIMSYLDYEKSNGFLFIYICGVVFCVYLLKNKKLNRLVIISLIAVLFPILTVRTFNDALVVCSVFVYFLYFIFKDISDIKYEYSVFEIKKSFAILFGLIMLSIISFNLKAFEKISWYYIVVFIASSVLYLRTQRNYYFGIYDKRYIRLNYINSAAICILTVAVCIRNVRESILRAMSFLYDKLTYVLAYIFSWIALIIGYLMNGGINALREFLKGRMNNYEKAQQDMKNSSYNNLPKVQDIKAKAMHINPYLLAVVKIVFLILIMYGVYRILRNRANKSISNEDFVESREYISDKDDRAGVVSRIKEFIKPKNNIEYIRYCYKNFMKKSINKGVDIQKSDTTADIDEKAKYSFNREALFNLRKFYIHARYGNTNIDKASLKLFNNYYRDLNK